jgi:phosphomannomutase
VEDLSLIEAAMARLRATPPSSLGGRPVVSVQDLSVPGEDSPLPPTDGLRYRTDGGVRVVVRPSGTEPKLKCYLEAVVPVAAGPDTPPATALPAARAEAAHRLAQVRTDLSEALGLE